VAAKSAPAAARNKTPAAAGPPESEGPKAETPKTYRYRCTEPCTFLKRYRKAGDIVELPGKRGVPHFELVE
jgi:hypothetical protein